MPSAAARLLYPPPGSSRRSELASATRQARRVGHKLARGLTPAQVARAEQLPEAEVDELLADPEFRELVTAYRELAIQPEAEVRGRLIRLALFVLEEAVIEGNVAAACFILYEEARGRNPAALLADAAIRSARRDPLPQAAPAAEAKPATAREPADPADCAAWRRSAALRGIVLQEFGAEATAQAAAEPAPASEPEPTAEPAPTSTTPPARRPSGRERKRDKWLARQAQRAANRPAPKARAP